MQITKEVYHGTLKHRIKEIEAQQIMLMVEIAELTSVINEAEEDSHKFHLVYLYDKKKKNYTYYRGREKNIGF